jgi:hypothetical protein
MSLFSDTIEPVRRSRPDELFLVRILAKPLPENKEAAKTGGAYVNGWIDAEDLRTAEQTALARIRAEQWRPIKFDDWKLLCRKCYTDDADLGEDERQELLKRVEEAFKCGMSFTFHCWPVDAPDAADEDA